MNEKELQILCDLKNWVGKKAKFQGRTEEAFLLMFLRSCEFDLKLTQKTLMLYYQNRVKIPEWWSNRDLAHPAIREVASFKTSTVLIDNLDKQHPTIILTRFSKFQSSSLDINSYLKLSSIILDVTVRRLNCQLNGVIWMIDCQNYPWWFALQIISPTFCKNFVNSFYLNIPVRLKSVIVLNSPVYASIIFKIIQPLISPEISKNVHFFGSEWPSLFNYISPEVLPEEYGGCAGLLINHEEAFLRELHSFNDYLIEDNKFGYSNFSDINKEII